MKTGNYCTALLFTAILLLLWSCKETTDHTKVKTMSLELGKDPLVAIQPTMYGIFFEDINSGADGGLYAELVKNRSFEFENPWMGWKHLPEAETRFNTINELTPINNQDKSENNRRYIRVDKRDESQNFGIQNEGFDGIGIQQNGKYDFSVWAKSNSGNIVLAVDLVDTAGHVLGGASVTPNGNTWKKYEVSFIANTTVQHALLNIYFKGKGQLDIDHVSLFPQDTWKGRKGGLRKDLVQLLADMKPGFVRFPGGCIVEGRTLAERYQWKKTIGPVEERKLLINRWNMEFAHRPLPDYFQTFGLGFFEYFQLAEDIGAEPLPILSCGLACQFNSSEMTPMEKLDPFIQDALDLIEFANGDKQSTWGSVRASMGHPAPFNLKFIGIGNEQWGEEYFERYAAFSKAIKSKYPAINLVSGTGPFAEGDLFQSAEKALSLLKPEIVDEHYYKNPKWFLDHADRYDHYDRNRYKIFAGEYAAQSVATGSPENKNDWQCALAEAAFMTGLERNADVVYMSSYAPLFAHINRWQWTPDLIWFDNLRSFGTANYEVQKLFSTHRGTHTLSLLHDGHALSGQDSLYGVASIDTITGRVSMKLVNASHHVLPLTINLQHADMNFIGKVITLKSNDLHAVNAINAPDVIKPIESNLNIQEGPMEVDLDPYSVKVIQLERKG
jgi:alpha-N-arabinofuranosidase